MTIEIADRLIKLRKQYGYSQEELADKLGLSRQAVSKWERAEASPDTDNLICLAKLYNISLDDLLSTDDDLETVVKEQVKHDEEEPKVETEEVKEGKDSISVGSEGIFIKDKDGSEVSITNKGIRCKDGDGRCVKVHKPDKFITVLGIVEAGLGILALIAFILLGTLLGMWYNAWVVFLVPEILCSLVRAIHKKNANEFNVPFTATFVFFFVCMILPGLEANLWHPMWVVFLSIPLYYITVSAINKAIGKVDEDENDDKDAVEVK